MRYLFIVLSVLFLPMTAAHAEVSVSISINMQRYPTLVRVPGYPVYYDPRVDTNYFFYDGLYWVLQGDDWYASSWYNGPWERVDRYDVPLYVLRVPVRYYRQPPSIFVAGVSMRRRIGVSTGGVTGSNVAAVGIIGTTAQRHRQLTSAIIPATAIRMKSSSNTLSAPRNIATSRVSL